MSYLYNNRIKFDEEAVDAFNRLQVVTPETLFDSQHRYRDNGKYDTGVTAGGTAYHNLYESSISMVVGTTSGSEVIRESKYITPYQPGKGLLFLTTFAFNAPKTNLRQRAGYFGSSNGIYVEHNGLTAYMVLRSSVTGVTLETRIPQYEWNGDKFDGTGPSGRVIDFSKANIYWLDIEWLGVGNVRTGFFVDGRPVEAHKFNNDNLNPTTYMTTACLPSRYEITNLAGQTGSSTMRQICTTVISEGGYQPKSPIKTTDGYTSRTATTAGVFVPFASIRLKQQNLDSVVIISGSDIVCDSNTILAYRLIQNGTLTGGSYVSHAPDSSVEQNITATGVTGGLIVQSGFVNSTSVIKIEDPTSFNLQLGRTLAGVSDTLTLAFTCTTSANTSAFGSLKWYEIV